MPISCCAICGLPWSETLNKKERPCDWNLSAQLNNIILDWDKLRLS